MPKRVDGINHFDGGPFTWSWYRDRPARNDPFWTIPQTRGARSRSWEAGYRFRSVIVDLVTVEPDKILGRDAPVLTVVQKPV